MTDRLVEHAALERRTAGSYPIGRRFSSSTKALKESSAVMIDSTSNPELVIVK